MARKHEIRLAILDALHRARRPLGLDELEEQGRMAQTGVSRTELMAEVPGLIGHGYMVNHLGQSARGYLLGITPRGRDQVTMDAPLEEYVRGEEAFYG